jgi:hypothetical protein
MYISTFSFTSALAGGEWSASRPGYFTSGKEPRYPSDRRLGGPQSRSGRLGEETILDITGTRTPTPRSSGPSPVAVPTPQYVQYERLFMIAVKNAGSQNY